MKQYDVIFVGGGPAGYTGAIRACELGLKTLLIEKEKIGGVCLNWGCIPTKAMLASALLADKINRAVQFGLEVRFEPPHKLWKIVEKKDAIVRDLSAGLEGTLKRKGVEVLQGKASFTGPHVLKVDGADGTEEVQGGAVVIATGSRPQELPGISFNGDSILSSNDILALNNLPQKLGIIGGGVIGCEFASLFRTLGAEVTVVEMLPQLLPNVDSDIAKRLETIFKRRGIQVFTGRKLEKLSSDGHTLSGLLSDGERFSCDKLLVAVGRKRNTDDLGLERAGIEADRGAIRVDEFLQTTAKGVFAAGDVIASPQLAHVAEAEARLIAENLKRTPVAMDYRGWPNTVFTHPEVAGAGLTKAEAEKQGIKVRETRYVLGALGKAHVEREPEGLFKLVFEESSRRVLGAHMIGDRVSELAGEISLAVRLGARVDDLAGTIHAHPTFSEMIWEAAKASL